MQCLIFLAFLGGIDHAYFVAAPTIVNGAAAASIERGTATLVRLTVETNRCTRGGRLCTRGGRLCRESLAALAWRARPRTSIFGGFPVEPHQQCIISKRSNHTNYLCRYSKPPAAKQVEQQLS